MTSTETISDTVEQFLGMWSRSYLDGDLARTLNCGEVDALAALYRAAGRPETAEAWIAAHAPGDDEAGAHHIPDEGYPPLLVDPMDDLHCDSCQ